MIDTPMLRRVTTSGDVGNIEQVASRLIPVRRAGTTDEIAATCAFLCSDEAAFITGQVVGVNGGAAL
jgi:2-hydroxycyclohexanecarboxyl-CoA dehydrogenase